MTNVNKEEIDPEHGMDPLVGQLLKCRRAFLTIRDELRNEGHGYTLAYTRADIAVMKIDKVLRDNGHELLLLHSATGGGNPFPTSKAE